MSLILQLLASTFRVSTPLVFAALGGMVSERAGVINIALEGFMLLGAFAAAAGTLATHSPWTGLLAAVLCGGAAAALYAFCVIQLRANQIVAGTAVNMLALGATPLACKVLYDVTGSTPALPLAERLQTTPVVLCWVVVVFLWFIMRWTRAGLRLQFAGESPEALDTAGVQVNRMRFWAVVISGGLAALGGACLSISLSSGFSRNMTAGRGFIALAALISGKWKPVAAATACLIFGLAEAVQMRLQGVALWGGAPIPVQLIQALPYVATILVLAGFVGRSRPPKALGKLFQRA